MSIFAPLLDPYLLLYACLIGMFALLARAIATHSRFYRSYIDAKLADPQFNAPLEGLRGLLALNVFCHHAAYTWETVTQGHWARPSSHLMVLLGGASVSLFFFLSGYLFWGSFLRQKEAVAFSRRQFYGLRLWRLGPVYAVCCLSIWAIVAAKTGFALGERPLPLLAGLGQWLAFGLPLGHFPDLNGWADTKLINSGVTWSLRHEVLFYLLLPFLRPWAKGHRTPWLLAGCAALYVALSSAVKFAGPYLQGHPVLGPLTPELVPALQDGVLDSVKFLVIGFLPGMLAAYVQRQSWGQALLRRLSGAVGLALVATCLLWMLLNTNPDHAYLNLPALWLIFIAVACCGVGASLLRRRSFVLLGLLSYSFYLLHGISLYILTPRGLDLYGAFGPPQLLSYWPVAALAGAVMLCICALLYRVVEMPGIEHGRRWRQARAQGPS